MHSFEIDVSKVLFSVSIGGILGLFMGASILSLVEFLYFFTVRTCNTIRQRKDFNEI